MAGIFLISASAIANEASKHGYDSDEELHLGRPFLTQKPQSSKGQTTIRSSSHPIRRRDCSPDGLAYGLRLVSELVAPETDELKDTLHIRDAVPKNPLFPRARIKPAPKKATAARELKLPGTKAFACDVPGCGKSYKGLRALKQHNSLKHSGVSARVQCPLLNCGTTLADKTVLKRHIAVVHGSLPHYKCKQVGCNSRFRSREALQVHARVHSQQEPARFHCTVPGCQKSFLHRSSLRTHRM